MAQLVVRIEPPCDDDLVIPEGATAQVTVTFSSASGSESQSVAEGWAPDKGAFEYPESFQSVWRRVFKKVVVEEGNYSVLVGVRLEVHDTPDAPAVVYEGRRVVTLVYGSRYEAAWAIHGTWLAGNIGLTGGDTVHPIVLASPGSAYLRMLWTPALVDTFGTSVEIFPAAGLTWSGWTIDVGTPEAQVYGGMKFNPVDVKLRGFDTNIALGGGLLWSVSGEPSFFFGLSTSSPVIEKNAEDNLSVPVASPATGVTAQPVRREED
jgi:hypothetical protein